MKLSSMICIGLALTVVNSVSAEAGEKDITLADGQVKMKAPDG